MPTICFIEGLGAITVNSYFLISLTRTYFVGTSEWNCSEQPKHNMFHRWENHHSLQGTKIFQYWTCPAGQVTYNFTQHLSFKSVCNREHKGVKCNMILRSNSSKSTCPTGWALCEEFIYFLDFTCNNEGTCGIFVPWSSSSKLDILYNWGTVLFLMVWPYALWVNLQILWYSKVELNWNGHSQEWILGEIINLGLKLSRVD